MGSEWSFTTIDKLKADSKGSIAIGPFGSRMKSDCYVDSGIPVIRGTNITGGPNFEGEFVYITEEKADTLGSSNVYQGDLVFPHRGAIGEVGILQEKKRFVLSSSLMKLTCDEQKAHPKFLYYFFKSHLGKHELLKNASQVGTPGIGQPLTSLKSIELSLPPLPEQKAIAHILGTLDDKIELNRRMNATLEGMAQALFKSWFVDFDPVIDNALAAGNPIPDELAPRAEVRKAALANGTTQQGSVDHPTLSDPRSLFPAAFQFTEELGWIPEGWTEGTVGDLCDVRKGLSYKGKFLTDDASKMPLINLGNFGGSGKFRYEKVKHYEGDFKERHLVKSGQLMIANTDMTQDRVVLGSPIVVPEFNAAEILFTHHTFAIDFRESYPEPIWKSYLYFVSQENEFRRRAEGFATGTTVLALPKDALLKCPIVLPAPRTVSAFSTVAADIFKKQAGNRDQAAMLNYLRDTLLPKLISGELACSNAPDS